MKYLISLVSIFILLLVWAMFLKTTNIGWLILSIIAFVGATTITYRLLK